MSASDETTATLEQREAVIKTILLVWEHRRTFPGRRPMQAFDNVFSALDRLGDQTPWRLFTLFDDDLSVGQSPRSSLLATMGDLERHTRDAMLTLLWLAAQEAREVEQKWHDASDRVALNVETDVHDRLAALSGSRRRRLRSLDLTPSTELTVDPSSPFDLDATDDVLDGQDDVHRLEPSILAARLREMAKVLLDVADDMEKRDSQ